jgi:uncharacterized membrane protein
MSTRPSALDRRPTLAALWDLRRAGVLDLESHARALDLVVPAVGEFEWRGFIRVAALSLGVAHVLAGLVYLLAWNWANIGIIPRFALVEGSFLVAAALALVLGTSELRGRLATTAAATLIGPVAALIGLTWPSGSPLWTLFAAWSALAVPFLVAAPWPPLTLAWLILVGTAVWTRWEWSGASSAIAIGVGAVALAIWELRDREAAESTRWWPRAVAALALVPSIGPAADAIFAASIDGVGDRVAALGVALAAALAVQVVYWRRRDLFIAAVGVAWLTVLVPIAASRPLIDAQTDPIVSTLALGVLVLVEGAVAGAWLALGVWLRNSDGAP